MNTTSLPGLELRLDGEPLPPWAQDAVTALRLIERLSCPGQLEVTLVQARRALPDVASGTRVTAAVGAPQTLLFEGEVTAVTRAWRRDGLVELRLRAYDRLHRLRRRVATAAIVATSAAALARELATAVGLGVGGGGDAPQRARVLPTGRSELDLLVDVAERAGLYLALRGGTLRLVALDDADERVELDPGRDLLAFTFERDAAVRADRVTAYTLDLHDGATGAASDGTEPAAILLAAAGGVDVLELPLVDRVADGASEARCLATVEQRRRRAAAETVTGTARGEPRLRPGAAVWIDGLDGVPRRGFVLTEVEHAIDAEDGYTTRFTSRPPPPLSRPRGTGLSLGRVTAVDDPDGLARVQVELPTQGGCDAGWLQVLMPAAGADKGLVALPDVGDEVLVLTLLADPAQAVVLGGLHGSRPLPDRPAARSGRTRRLSLRTPGGQRVLLDDADATLRLVTRDGGSLEIGPKGALLEVAGDAVIAAKGKVVVRGAAIEFERS